jgi:hypothetical protein
MFGMLFAAQREAFDLWQKSIETGMASMFVVERRMGMMQSGKFKHSAELARMIPEKLAALGEAQVALAGAMLSGASAAASATAALAPIHARATANAKRLRRR